MEKITPINKNSYIAQSEEKPPAEISRRKFLQGVGVVSLTSNLPNYAKANVETSLRPKSRPSVESAVEDIEYLKTLTYKNYEPPKSKALRFTELLDKDLDEVVENIQSLGNELDTYSSFSLMLDEAMDLSIMPEPIGSTIKEFMFYVPYVESRFNNNTVSSAQAFGLVQLMPATWAEHSEQDEDQNNVVDQIKVAGRLLGQIYRHLMNTHTKTIEKITQLLFAGDKEKCAQEFVAPLIINAYFSGSSTINDVLTGFFVDYVNEAEKQKMHQKGILADEMGVYGLFSTAGEYHGYSNLYGIESSNYVPKIIAAKLVMYASLPQDLLAELIVGLDKV